MRTLDTRTRRRGILPALAAIAAVLTLTCAPAAAQSAGAPAPGQAPLATCPVLRLGYFPNVTHAPALVAKQRGLLESQLRKQGTTVQWTAFNAGPSVIEALKGGALDASYIGPNPAINGFATTRGALLRIVSGSTSGGAALIVKPSILTVADLRGKRIATPQLGNTQDVALRSWLDGQGYRTSITGAGDVTVIPTENATALALFQRGDIDGAWTVEPWTSRLVLEGGGRVFLDEKSLWPNGRYLTTHIISATPYLEKCPGTVRSLLAVHLTALGLLASDPVGTKEDVQTQIAGATGKRLPDPIIERAWPNLTFTYDPLAATVVSSADSAVAAGLLTTLGSRGLSGIYDLRLLNGLLAQQKKPRVSAQGLGLQ